MPNVAVLGAGAWGTALGKVLADKGNAVSLWSHRAELAERINRDHVNARYLPVAQLPPNLLATSDLSEALHGAELVVVVVPSHALRGVVRQARSHIPAG